MREQFYKIKELHKGVPFNLHRHMLSIKHNTVLIVINIRRILEAPWTVIDCNRNNSVILSGRMVHSARITLIFHTQQAFWIAALFCIFCCCNGFWIFLRFRQIDGNINGAIRTVHCPFSVFFNTVTADIITVLT